MKVISQRTYTLDKGASQKRQSSALFNKTNEINQLKNLFLHYSNNEPYITNKQYIKFLSDSQLIDNISLTQKYSNILFYSFSKAKNVLSFQGFCDLIVKIIELKYQDTFFQDQASCTTSFFETYITPLIQILTSVYTNDKEGVFPSTNFNLIISKIASYPNQEIINSNFLLFTKLYLKYFCFENLKISKSQKSHLSLRAFLKIMRDFEVCPYYIGVNQLTEVFNVIMNNPDYSLGIMMKILNPDVNRNEGMFFTLYHFIVSIYLTSVLNIIHTSLEQGGDNENSSPQINGKLYEVFLSNNDSVGFQKLIRVFLISKELSKVMPEEIKSFEQDRNEREFNQNPNMDNPQIASNQFIRDDVNQVSSEIKKPLQQTNKNSTRISYQNNCSTITLRDKLINDNEQLYTMEEMAPLVLRKYYSVLLNIYKFYSELYYETNFSIYMTQNGFIKLVRDMGLVETNIPNEIGKITNITDLYVYNKLKANLLTFPSINFYFSKFSSNKLGIKTSNSSNKKLNFENFLKIILCLSNKIYNPQYNNISYDNKSFTIENLFQQECPIKYAYGFIENYLSPLYTDIKNFIEEESFSYENLEVIFSADPVKKFISNITNGLVSILKLYTDGRNTITYNEYFKVLSDFEIFPDLVTRTKMIKIFINFINDFDKEFIIKSNNKVFLSIDKCAYAILFIALGSGENTNIKIDNGEIIIRIMNFIQRMIQTNGLEKITIKSGKPKIGKDFIKMFSFYKNQYKKNSCDNNTQSRTLYDMV